MVWLNQMAALFINNLVLSFEDIFVLLVPSPLLACALNSHLMRVMKTDAAVNNLAS
jgi:hypothetical protein